MPAAVVVDDPAEDHPTVAVEEFRAGRPRRGVVVDAGPLDLGPVPLGRRVIEGQQQSLPRDIEATPQQSEDDGGDRRGLATDAVEEVVVGSEASADPGGPPPTGSGATAVGQEDAERRRRASLQAERRCSGAARAATQAIHSAVRSAANTLVLPGVIVAV